jgi:hypothetical protein
MEKIGSKPSIDRLINGINLEALIKGSLLAVILGTILGFFELEFLGYLIAAVYVGYSIKGNYMGGAIHEH